MSYAGHHVAEPPDQADTVVTSVHPGLPPVIHYRTGSQPAITAPMAQVAGPHHPRVLIVIPAHNEEATLAATIKCLHEQGAAPDYIIVACDNCADDTERVAARCDVDTWVTRSNRHMKAGALNQVLEWMIPLLDDRDIIMIVDADTHISENFTREARLQLMAHPNLGGVSGVYGGKPGGGFAGWCQRNEFARWAFDGRQLSGKAICLSGAASAFTVHALRTVRDARRAGVLSGGDSYYSVTNFTEDFELTQALLHCGFGVKNMMNVSITTAIKPTWAELHTQRLRWNRGITETLMEFGLTRHTAKMWLRWLLYTLSVITIPLSFFLIGYRFSSGEGWPVNDWMLMWFSVTGIMALHKSVTIMRTRGWSWLAALVLIPEMLYDSFLHLTFLRSLCQVIAGTGKTWR